MKKVAIPKEKLIELYVDKKMTTHEIAQIYDVDRTTISNRLKEFNIDSNPSIRKYYLLKEDPLTKDQKDLIVGSTLGDASVIRPKGSANSYFKIAHCEKQRDYIFWKKEILGNLVNVVSKHEDKRGNSIMYQFNTLRHKELNFYRNLFYQNNKKVIVPNIGNYLTPLGLTAWYLDDGNRISKGVCCKFSTDGFSYNENVILANTLKANFDLNVKICEYERHSTKFYYLLLNKRNFMSLTEIIKDYVIDSMKYKLSDCSSTTTCQTPDSSG